MHPPKVLSLPYGHELDPIRMTTASTRGPLRAVGSVVATPPVVDWNRPRAGDARDAAVPMHETVTI